MLAATPRPHVRCSHTILHTSAHTQSHNITTSRPHTVNQTPCSGKGEGKTTQRGLRKGGRGSVYTAGQGGSPGASQGPPPPHTSGRNADTHSLASSTHIRLRVQHTSKPHSHPAQARGTHRNVTPPNMRRRGSQAPHATQGHTGGTPRAGDPQMTVPDTDQAGKVSKRRFVPGRAAARRTGQSLESEKGWGRRAVPRSHPRDPTGHVGSHVEHKNNSQGPRDVPRLGHQHAMRQAGAPRSQPHGRRPSPRGSWRRHPLR